MIHRTLAFVIAFLVAGVFAQLPEFGQQYRQRLGGALDELRAIISNFDADAQANNLDRTAALTRLRQNPDLLVQDQAMRMAAIVDRYTRLNAQADAYRNAGPVARLVTIAENYDPVLMDGTLRDYEPAVPTTAEGLVTAGSGFLLTLLGLSFVGQIGRHVRHLRRRRQTAA